jgi:hypothetical protein
MQGLSGWVVLAVNLLVVIAVMLAVAPTTRAAATMQQPATIENPFLVVRFDPADGKLHVTPKTAGGAIKELSFAVPRERAVANVSKQADGANALEFRGNDGSTQTFWLYDDQPFLFSRLSLTDKTSDPNKFSTIVPLSFAIETSGATSDLKWFGSDGPGAAGEGKTSYVFLALVDPKTRAGVVSGWITHERASGIVAGATRENSALAIDARSEYGKLTVAPGASVDGETFALGFFDDARLGLEAFADATARVNKIKLPPAYCGYSTWYHAHALDEKRMAELAKFVKDNHLGEFGLNFLQIDDQWQVARRDFTTHKTGEKAPYPSGMKQTAESIKSAGLIAGLWLTPFGWQGRDFQDDKPSQNNTVMKDHPDWFVKRSDGSIYWVKWAGDCLDMTNPQAREFLAGVIKRITHDWGYKLLKLDGLWSGMACSILYPDPKYRDDHLGDAVFYDPTKTNEEVYRSGLRLVREAAGPDVFLLGCNIAQNMRTMGGSIGLVDAMRVGPDIKADWSAVVRCAKPASYLYFWNGRVWHNDPDCLMLRDPLTLDNARAWGSWIALSGQLNLVSEWLPGLPPEKLEVWKRTVPNHERTNARPVDLFDSAMPRIWHLSSGEGDSRFDLVGLFNWDPKERTSVTIDPKQFGLPESAKLVGFDYWANEFIAPFNGKKEFELAGGSCRVMALRREQDRPQLISTSRHVTQGLVDVVKLEWDPKSNTLRGRAKVVGGDDYELRIDAPGARARAPEISDDDRNAGVTVGVAKQSRRQVRVTIKSPVTREVTWEIQFSADGSSR